MELITGSDYILLPKFLVSKRSILNPKNIDYRSFGYAIIFAQYPKDWREYSSQPSMDIHFEQLGLNKIKYPCVVKRSTCMRKTTTFELMFLLLTMQLGLNAILIKYLKSSNLKK